MHNTFFNVISTKEGSIAALPLQMPASSVRASLIRTLERALLYDEKSEENFKHTVTFISKPSTAPNLIPAVILPSEV